MKKGIKKLLFVFALLIMSVGCEEDSGDPTVYVCTGSYAYAYHANDYCRGLNNCKDDVVFVSVTKAKKMGNKKPCDICY